MYGIDFAYNSANLNLTGCKQYGIKFVARYYSSISGKNLTPLEAKAYWNVVKFSFNNASCLANFVFNCSPSGFIVVSRTSLILSAFVKLVSMLSRSSNARLM